MARRVRKHPDDQPISIGSRDDGQRSGGIERQTNTFPAAPTHAAEFVSFGPFKLDSKARLLEQDGKPVNVGARAFDILCMLVDHAGEVVTKRDLFSRVWKGVSVEEDSLRFHVSALRKALGQHGSGARYVITLAGQGYCFVAPVSRVGPVSVSGAESRGLRTLHSAPPPLARMVGRDKAIRQICERVLDDRFVTLVGPGGIGKTTVAVAVVQRVAAEFNEAVCFLDLASVSDPTLVPSFICAALNLAVQSKNPTADLITFLRDKRMLLVLDSCELAIDVVAAIAERLYQGAARVHLLGTSREALRVEGEQVVQILPLESPPENVAVHQLDLLDFSATQLFLERVRASGPQIQSGDVDARFVAEICRNLDGIPLAIELAAGRVAAFGIQGTAAMLKDRLELLQQGRRTALLRHQTLVATLDWSYDLLDELERRIFQRLGVFVGTFTMEATRSVVADAGEAGIEIALASLIAKSLVSADSSGSLVRYRLLDTTRTYCNRKLNGSGEASDIARRHAEFFAAFLQQLDFDIERVADAFAAHGEHIGNVRAALEWAFAESRDQHLCVVLAARAAPFFFELSLLTECRKWCAQGLESLDDRTRGTRPEMELQSALGLSLMFTESNSEEAKAALERGLSIAIELKDLANQLRLLGRLHLFHYRTGAFRTALTFAEQSEAVAHKLGDPVGIAAAHSLLGISHHLMDDLPRARGYLQSSLVLLPVSQRINPVQFGLDYRNRAGICLARTLWLLGFPEQAANLARSVVEDAANLDHPVTLCIALIWAVTVFLWIGDWEAAEEYMDRLVRHARSRSITPYPAAGSGVEGYLAIKRGEARRGVALIESSLKALQRHRYELLTTSLRCALAEGLAMLGERGRALETVDHALSLVERNGDLFNVPELLRIKGEILALGPRPELRAAEECLIHSLALASRRGVLSWELRTAMSLARLLSDQDRFDEAIPILSSPRERFTEGFGSPDLRHAGGLLEDMRARDRIPAS